MRKIDYASRSVVALISMPLHHYNDLSDTAVAPLTPVVGVINPVVTDEVSNQSLDGASLR